MQLFLILFFVSIFSISPASASDTGSQDEVVVRSASSAHSEIPLRDRRRKKRAVVSAVAVEAPQPDETPTALAHPEDSEPLDPRIYQTDIPGTCVDKYFKCMADVLLVADGWFDFFGGMAHVATSALGSAVSFSTLTPEIRAQLGLAVLIAGTVGTSMTLFKAMGRKARQDSRANLREIYAERGQLPPRNLDDHN